jgi:hypothetical protein
LLPCAGARYQKTGYGIKGKTGVGQSNRGDTGRQEDGLGFHRVASFLLRSVVRGGRKAGMQINMTTFAGRACPYIHETLQSLFASDWRETNLPVNLIMGSADESHIREYTAHSSVRIVPWDAETNAILRWNCTLNKIRALRYGADTATLICEDDILFSPNWLSALKLATAEMGDEEYILSLFAAEAELENARLVAGKRRVKRYPTFILQGSQALFYPTQTLRNKVADFLQENLTRGNGDELIGKYARAHAALYATKEILVDNIGLISCFHQKARTP